MDCNEKIAIYKQVFKWRVEQIFGEYIKSYKNQHKDFDISLFIQLIHEIHFERIGTEPPNVDYNEIQANKKLYNDKVYDLCLKEKSYVNNTNNQA